ncbi:MAG: hypothetical protein ACRDH8_13015 [Actinomycetota bacterium]
MATDEEARREREDAEERGRDLKPDRSPEARLSGDLSDEDPEGREERSPPPPTYDVGEDGED